MYNLLMSYVCEWVLLNVRQLHVNALYWWVQFFFCLLATSMFRSSPALVVNRIERSTVEIKKFTCVITEKCIQNHKSREYFFSEKQNLQVRIGDFIQAKSANQKLKVYDKKNSSHQNFEFFACKFLKKTLRFRVNKQGVLEGEKFS